MCHLCPLYITYAIHMYNICHISSHIFTMLPMLSSYHLWLIYVHHMSPMFIICHICSVYDTSHSHMFTKCHLNSLYVTMFTIFHLRLRYGHPNSLFTYVHLRLRCGHHTSPMLIIYHICSPYDISVFNMLTMCHPHS